MSSLQPRWDAWSARRRERRALRALGETLPPSEEVAGLDQRLEALSGALRQSLDRDRADYAALPGWARPLVVLRGLFDRAVLRALRLAARRERALACERLGLGSVEVAQGLDAEVARAAHQAAFRAQARLEPLPVALREAGHFSTHVWKEGRAQLLPRVPALLGLAVGWWIAQTFTDSQLSATLHSWGLGQGPRHAVRSETLQAMKLWLPLLAAAVSSYAGSRLAAFVRSRYAPAPDATASREPPRAG